MSSLVLPKKDEGSGVVYLGATPPQIPLCARNDMPSNLAEGALNYTILS